MRWALLDERLSDRRFYDYALIELRNMIAQRAPLKEFSLHISVIQGSSC